MFTDRGNTGGAGLKRRQMNSTWVTSGYLGVMASQHLDMWF